MAPKTYSSFFFRLPHLPVSPPPLPSSPDPTAPFRSFLSLEPADSIHSSFDKDSPSDDEREDDEDDEDDASICSQCTQSTAFSERTSSSFFPNPIPYRESAIVLSLDTAVPIPDRADSPQSSASTSTAASASSAAYRALPKPKPVPRAILPEVPSPKRAASPPPPPVLPSPPKSTTRLMRRLSTSTASTAYRRAKRTDALARLEGRTHDAAPRSFSPPPYSPVPPLPVRAKSAAPVLATKSFMVFSGEDSTSEEDEDDGDDDADKALARGRVHPHGTRVRRKTIDSWFVGPPSQKGAATQTTPQPVQVRRSRTDGRARARQQKRRPSKDSHPQPLKNFMEFEDPEVDVDARVEALYEYTFGARMSLWDEGW